MFGARKKSARLALWNTRRPASAAELALPALWRRPVLHRLAAALVTALALTVLLAGNGGPPFACRVHQTLDYDLRVRVPFRLFSPVAVDKSRDDEPKPGTKPNPLTDIIRAGTVLARAGQPVTEWQLVLLHEEHRAFVRSLRASDLARRWAGVFLIVLLQVGVVSLYVVRFQKQLAESTPKVIGVCLLAVLAVWGAVVSSRAPWHGTLAPLTLAAVVVAVAYNPPFALLTALTLALATTVALGTDLGHLLILMAAMATAVMLLGHVRTRARFVEVAAAAGLAALLMTVGVGLLTNQTERLVRADAARNFAWTLLAGLILCGTLPAIERWFGAVTDVSLLELSDSSHPLLQELIRRAPGTYTHSMTVATLAEGAAESIGANGLLARVGSYFHDVGKMLKPHYFIENQSGENRHDQLEPAMSTLVITAHVKDGLALADQYRLPRPLRDLIEQHHGTTLVEYFYRRQLRAQEEQGHGGSADLQYTFRYPGPRPQSREAGILMLSDAAESASRAVSAPTPGALRKLVHDLMMKRLLDGQFDESGLTLTELALVEESLTKSLVALYHHRIRYPGQEGPPAEVRRGA